MIVRQPLEIIESGNQFDIFINVSGGGLSGQAGAIRHGLSRALVVAVEDSRSPLKKRVCLPVMHVKWNVKNTASPGPVKATSTETLILELSAPSEPRGFSPPFSISGSFPSGWGFRSFPPFQAESSTQDPTSDLLCFQNQ